MTDRFLTVPGITTRETTPCGKGVDRLDSIMQPAAATVAPAEGLALTAETAVPGCGPGANQGVDVELAVRFCPEVVKTFG